MQNSTTSRSLLNLSRIAILLCVTLNGCGPSEPSEEDKDKESRRVEEVLRREKDVPITKDESDNLPEKDVPITKDEFDNLPEKDVPITKDDFDNLPEKAVALTKDEFDKLLTREAHTNEIPKNVFYRITGVVEQRKAEISKATSDIRLILKPWQDSRVEVNCLFNGSSEPKISAKQVGETVNVAGVLNSISESTVWLRGCKLEE